MLQAEQEDEEDEDLKDLIAEMELDVEAAAAFRAAIKMLAPKTDLGAWLTTLGLEEHEALV